MRRRPALWLAVLVAGFVVFGAFAAYHYGPWLTGERGIVVSTPVGFPIGDPQEVKLAPGAPVCLTEVGVTTEAQRAVFSVRTHGRPASPLSLTLEGDGYRASGSVREYGDGETAAVQIVPPRRDVLARACFANRGERSVWLIGTVDVRAASIQTDTLVDGEPANADVSLRFDEVEPVSLVEQASDSLARLELWKPGFVPAALLWLVIALVLVGVPAAGIAAYALSLRGD